MVGFRIRHHPYNDCSDGDGGQFPKTVISLSERGDTKMPRPVHFEIDAYEPERAAKFYKEVFGWQIHKWEGPTDYWLIVTGEDGETGINGGMNRQEAGKPAATVNTVGVTSVDESIARITDNGGKVVAPKMTIPGVGYLA